MREAGAQVVTPYEGGLAGTTDESWLAHIGSRRWLALMRDQQVRLQGINDRKIVEAMGTTSTATFTIWEKRQGFRGELASP